MVARSTSWCRFRNHAHATARCRPPLFLRPVVDYFTLRTPSLSLNHQTALSCVTDTPVLHVLFPRPAPSPLPPHSLALPHGRSLGAWWIRPLGFSLLQPRNLFIRFVIVPRCLCYPSAHPLSIALGGRCLDFSLSVPFFFTSPSWSAQLRATLALGLTFWVRLDPAFVWYRRHRGAESTQSRLASSRPFSPHLIPATTSHALNNMCGCPPSFRALLPPFLVHQHPQPNRHTHQSLIGILPQLKSCGTVFFLLMTNGNGSPVSLRSRLRACSEVAVKS